MKYLPLIFALGFSSCSTSENHTDDPTEETKEKKPKVEKQIIGRIASVSSTGGFVLIEKYGPGKMPVNAIIQTVGPGDRHASLDPSGEQVRNFFAADLNSGSVEIGDAVVAYYDQPQEAIITPIKDEAESKKTTTVVKNGGSTDSTANDKE